MTSPGPAAAASPCGSAPRSPHRAVSPCEGGQSLAYKDRRWAPESHWGPLALDAGSPPASLALGHLRPLSCHLGATTLIIPLMVASSPPRPSLLSLSRVPIAPSLSHHLGLHGSGSSDSYRVTKETPGASSSSNLALLPSSQPLQKGVSRSPSEVMLQPVNLSR